MWSFRAVTVVIAISVACATARPVATKQVGASQAMVDRVVLIQIDGLTSELLRDYISQPSLKEHGVIHRTTTSAREFASTRHSLTIEVPPPLPSVPSRVSATLLGAGNSSASTEPITSILVAHGIATSIVGPNLARAASGAVPYSAGDARTIDIAAATLRDARFVAVEVGSLPEAGQTPEEQKNELRNIDDELARLLDAAPSPRTVVIVTSGSGPRLSPKINNAYDVQRLAQFLGATRTRSVTPTLLSFTSLNDAQVVKLVSLPAVRLVYRRDKSLQVYDRDLLQFRPLTQEEMKSGGAAIAQAFDADASIIAIANTADGYYFDSPNSGTRIDAGPNERSWPVLVLGLGKLGLGALPSNLAINDVPALVLTLLGLRDATLSPAHSGQLADALLGRPSGGDAATLEACRTAVARLANDARSACARAIQDATSIAAITEPLALLQRYFQARNETGLAAEIGAMAAAIGKRDGCTPQGDVALLSSIAAAWPTRSAVGHCVIKLSAGAADLSASLLSGIARLSGASVIVHDDLASLSNVVVAAVIPELARWDGPTILPISEPLLRTSVNVIAARVRIAQRVAASWNLFHAGLARHASRELGAIDLTVLAPAAREWMLALAALAEEDRWSKEASGGGMELQTPSQIRQYAQHGTIIGDTPFLVALRTLAQAKQSTESDPCFPGDPGDTAKQLREATVVFEALGNHGLSARARSSAAPVTQPSRDEIESILTSLTQPDAGWVVFKLGSQLQFRALLEAGPDGDLAKGVGHVILDRLSHRITSEAREGLLSSATTGSVLEDLWTITLSREDADRLGALLALLDGNSLSATDAMMVSALRTAFDFDGSMIQFLFAAAQGFPRLQAATGRMRRVITTRRATVTDPAVIADLDMYDILLHVVDELLLVRQVLLSSGKDRAEAWDKLDRQLRDDIQKLEHASVSPDTKSLGLLGHRDDLLFGLRAASLVSTMLRSGQVPGEVNGLTVMLGDYAADYLKSEGAGDDLVQDARAKISLTVHFLEELHRGMDAKDPRTLRNSLARLVSSYLRLPIVKFPSQAAGIYPWMGLLDVISRESLIGVSATVSGRVSEELRAELERAKIEVRDVLAAWEKGATGDFQKVGLELMQRALESGPSIIDAIVAHRNSISTQPIAMMAGRIYQLLDAKYPRAFRLSEIAGRDNMAIAIMHIAIATLSDVSRLLDSDHPKLERIPALVAHTMHDLLGAFNDRTDATVPAVLWAFLHMTWLGDSTRQLQPFLATVGRLDFSNTTLAKREVAWHLLAASDHAHARHWGEARASIKRAIDRCPGAGWAFQLSLAQLALSADDRTETDERLRAYETAAIAASAATVDFKWEYDYKRGSNVGIVMFDIRGPSIAAGRLRGSWRVGMGQRTGTNLVDRDESTVELDAVGTAEDALAMSSWLRAVAALRAHNEQALEKELVRALNLLGGYDVVGAARPKGLLKRKAVGVSMLDERLYLWLALAAELHGHPRLAGLLVGRIAGLRSQEKPTSYSYLSCPDEAADPRGIDALGCEPPMLLADDPQAMALWELAQYRFSKKYNPARWIAELRAALPKLGSLAIPETIGIEALLTSQQPAGNPSKPLLVLTTEHGELTEQTLTSLGPGYNCETAVRFLIEPAHTARPSMDACDSGTILVYVLVNIARQPRGIAELKVVMNKIFDLRPYWPSKLAQRVALWNELLTALNSMSSQVEAHEAAQFFRGLSTRAQNNGDRYVSFFLRTAALGVEWRAELPASEKPEALLELVQAEHYEKSALARWLRRATFQVRTEQDRKALANDEDVFTMDMEYLDGGEP